MVRNRDNEACEESKDGNHCAVDVEDWYERYDDEGGYMYYYNANTGGLLEHYPISKRFFHCQHPVLVGVFILSLCSHSHLM